MFARRSCTPGSRHFLPVIFFSLLSISQMNWEESGGEGRGEGGSTEVNK